MKIKLVNNFSGGLAQDIREPKTNTFSYASGFDTFSNAHKLTPYRTMETESIDSGTLSNYAMSDVVIMKDSVNTNIYALGQAGAADLNPKFFQKSTVMDISSAFQAATGGEDTTNSVLRGTLEAYKSKLYCLKTDNTNTFLTEYNHSTTTTSTKADGGASTTLNGLTNTNYGVKPFRHPMDDILYIAHGYTISKLDNTTLTRNVFTIPSDYYITSLTDFGAYLFIMTAPVVGGLSSKAYLWNRDTTLQTATEVIDFGQGSAMVSENINGAVVVVMSSRVPTTNSVFNLSTKLMVKAYTGGKPQTLFETTTTSETFNLYNFKAIQDNRLYFACSASINGTSLHQIFVCGKNSSGMWVVSPDRLINNNTALSGTIQGFSIIGDYLWVGFNGNGSFYRTRYASATFPTATYESLINPSMEENDRTQKKNLKFVSVSKSSTTGQLDVSVSVDGGAYQSVVSLSSGGALSKKETRLSTGAPIPDGYEFKFKVESTNGAEFTELKYGYDLAEKNI